MNSECVVLMGHYLDILDSESVSPVSRVFSNWKRPVASYILLNSIQEASVQFSSVAQSCPTLSNLRDYSMTGFPVHQQCPELTQTHVY